MDEENNVSSVAEEDEIIVEDDVIIGDIIEDDIIIVVTSPITDKTSIAQNYEMSSLSSIALQVTNLKQEYTGSISYEWTLQENTPDGEIILHSLSIDDTGGYVTSPAAIFTGLSTTSTYTAHCVVYYSAGDNIIYEVWESNIISCEPTQIIIGDYEPDFSNIEINLVEATDTSFIVTLVNLDENYTGEISIQWRVLNEDGSLYYINPATQTGGNPESDEMELPNLSPGTTYVIYAVLTYYVNGDSYTEGTSEPYTTESSDDSGDTPTIWEVSKVSLGTITETFSDSISIYAGEVVRFKFDFDTAGEAEMYTTGSGDTIGYFGTSTDFREDDGRPRGYDEKDDDSGTGNNFKISCEVEADTTYYLWVRFVDITDSGRITICIVPPDGEDIGGGGGEDTDDIPDMTDVHIVEQETDDPYTKLAFRLEGLDTRYSAGNWDIDWYVYKDGSRIGNFSDDRSPVYPESKTISISGLEPDTTYEVQCRIRYYDADGVLRTIWRYSTDSDTEGDFTTSEDEGFTESGAKIVAESSKDGTSITAYVTGLDTSYSRDGRWINWYLDGTWKGQTSGISAGVSDTKDDPFLFDRLTPKTKYTIRAEIYFINNGASASKDIYITITTLRGRPAEFEWTYPKVKNKPFNLTAQEWCDLLNNINEVVVYLGKDEVAKGTGLAQFYYPSPNETFTAAMYNQVIYQFYMLGLMDYKAVSPGDPVTADCLNLLQETINSVE